MTKRKKKDKFVKKLCLLLYPDKVSGFCPGSLGKEPFSKSGEKISHLGIEIPEM